MKHFFQKKKGTRGHQFLILQPLLEKTTLRKEITKFQINMQKFGKDFAKICKEFAKNFAKNLQKICKKFAKNLQKILQKVVKQNLQLHIL